MTYRNFVEQNDLCLQRSPVTKKNNYDDEKETFLILKKMSSIPREK